MDWGAVDSTTRIAGWLEVAMLKLELADAAIINLDFGTVLETVQYRYCTVEEVNKKKEKKKCNPRNAGA